MGGIGHIEPIQLVSQSGEEQLFQTLCASPKDRHGHSLAWCGPEPPRKSQTTMVMVELSSSSHAQRLNESNCLHSGRHSSSLSALAVNDARKADQADKLDMRNASWPAGLIDEQLRGEPGRTRSLPTLPTRPYPYTSVFVELA